jgi:hypothetical protein
MFMSGGQPVFKRFGFFAVLLCVGTLAAQTPPTQTPPASTAPAAPPVAGGEAELAWKFNPNDIFFQKLHTVTDQQMKTGSLTVSQKQEQTFVLEWKVVSKTDTEVVLEQTIRSVAMKITIQNNEIKYDSTAKDAEQNSLAPFFKPIIGTKFTIHIDPKKPEVTKVVGREQFVAKLRDSNPLIGDMLNKILTDDQLKKMSEPAFALVPQGKKKPGDSWERQGNMNMGPIGSYEAKYKYTYKGAPANSKLHTIEVDTNLTWKAPDPKEVSTLPFKIEGGDLKTTEAKGTVTFDAEKGRVAEQKMVVKLKGKLTISVGGDQKGEKGDVELEQTQTTTTVTSDKNPNETATPPAGITPPTGTPPK